MKNLRSPSGHPPEFSFGASLAYDFVHTLRIAAALCVAVAAVPFWFLFLIAFSAHGNGLVPVVLLLVFIAVSIPAAFVGTRGPLQRAVTRQAAGKIVLIGLVPVGYVAVTLTGLALALS